MIDHKQIEFWYQLDRPKFDKYFEDVCSLASMFKVPNKFGIMTTLKLTQSQKELYFAIVTQWKKRILALTITRWGKSFIIAKGVVTSMVTTPNAKWTIVAPTESKAKIIFDYIKQDLYSNPKFFDMIPKKFADSREKLLHEKSQTRITLSNGSSVRLLSADVDNKQQAGMKLMGFGANKLIIDESAELSDDIHVKAFRMLGDNPEDSFICELGNPWYRNHFFDSYMDPGYSKIIIDWEKALDEGRTTQKFIDEMRKKPHFDVLYELKFPAADRISKDGWMPLFHQSMLENSIIEDEEAIPGGRKILGVDLSYSGADENVWCVRDNMTLRIVGRDNSRKPLDIVGKTIMIAQQEGIKEEDIYIDATAGGNIVLDAFEKANYNVNGVNFGMAAYNGEEYRDRKSEMYHQLYNWVSNGGHLVNNDFTHSSEHNILGDWTELLNMKVKKMMRGQFYMISKEELRKLLGRSPDVCDAAVLTCADGIDNAIESRYNEKSERIKTIRKQQTRYN